MLALLQRHVRTGRRRAGDLGGAVPGRCEHGIEDGANALAGGTANTLSLRSVSVDRDVGVSLAIGVTALKLHLAN
ncbi:DUF992 domain-containing protein [Rhizobium sp. PRIMUS64]|uniref:DUF992 domain-containing protein n=1 Tax=Rhizobium sp. PRIMUS64 TaxID=2908925 RepID=UPI0038D4C301